MNRALALKILNPILAVLVLNQALTGMFSSALPHEAFEILHEGGGALLILGVVLHVDLNWNWVKGSFFRRAAG